MKYIYSFIYYVSLFILLCILAFIFKLFYDKIQMSVGVVKENFVSGKDLLDTVGNYPGSVTQGGMLTFYPHTDRRLDTSNNGATNIWWHYPVFRVGSYQQITNNIRYPNNPDQGRCTPAEFCGALYKEKQLKKNTVKVLPAVPECQDGSVRVGYTRSYPNLLYFHNLGNILY